MLAGSGPGDTIIFIPQRDENANQIPPSEHPNGVPFLLAQMENASRGRVKALPYEGLTGMPVYSAQRLMEAAMRR